MPAQAHFIRVVQHAVNHTRRDVALERAEPGQILASASIIDCLGDLVVADSLGEVQVKGRKEPTTIYTLRGLA